MKSSKDQGLPRPGNAPPITASGRASSYTCPVHASTRMCAFFGLVVATALLAGCGGGGDDGEDVEDGGDGDSGDSSGSAGSVELGTGTTAFEPIGEESDQILVAGPQGGHHFVVHARMSGLDPGNPFQPGLVTNPATRFSVTDEEGVHLEIEMTPYRLGYEQVEGSYLLPSGRNPPGQGGRGPHPVRQPRAHRGRGDGCGGRIGDRRPLGHRGRGPSLVRPACYAVWCRRESDRLHHQAAERGSCRAARGPRAARDQRGAPRLRPRPAGRPASGGRRPGGRGGAGPGHRPRRGARRRRHHAARRQPGRRRRHPDARHQPRPARLPDRRSIRPRRARPSSPPSRASWRIERAHAPARRPVPARRRAGGAHRAQRRGHPPGRDGAARRARGVPRRRVRRVVPRRRADRRARRPARPPTTWRRAGRSSCPDQARW